ncbi:MAG TPA: hypothetical protein VK034_05065, partial [Enhygromyxa sp.]|nr:hypothetical protein [Enhygromyxa sp.]
AAGGAAPSPEKQAADDAYQRLLEALTAYEQQATISTTERVLDSATQFLDCYEQVGAAEQGQYQRITNHAKTLINEAYADLHDRLNQALPNAQVTNTDVDQTIAQLQNPHNQPEYRRMLRHRHRLGIKARPLAQVADDGGPAIVQSWRARGDMYHVGAVLNLYPQLKIILYDLEAWPGVQNANQHERERELARRWEQACMIADYYNQPNRVFYTFAAGVAGKASKAAAYDFHAKVSVNPRAKPRDLFIDVGGCTTIVGLEMARARERGHYQQRKTDLARAVAPDPVDNQRADQTEILHFLRAGGWKKSEKYVIINFRDSGHAHIQRKIATAADPSAVKNAYDPKADQVGGNHPELDTGAKGVKQLAELVRERGFTAVYMGEAPAGARGDKPSLIKYWTFKHNYGPGNKLLELCRGGRSAEAYFMRVIAEHFDVRLLAMRSGVTDQLAFLGIPTISIDVDNFHQAAAPELLDTPGYLIDDDETAHSWARGTKLEAGLQRDYGRVFLSRPRALNDFNQHGKWTGEIGAADLDVIDDAIGFYFGSADAAAEPSVGIRHASHPLHPTKMAATASKPMELPVGREMLIHRDRLRKGAKGKIDTGLNPEVVVAHIRTILADDATHLGEARAFADSHLDFTGNFSAREVDQRRAFLGAIIPAFGASPHAESYRKARATLPESARHLEVLRLAFERLRVVLDDPASVINRTDRKAKSIFQALAKIDLDPTRQALASAEENYAIEAVNSFIQRLHQLALMLISTFGAAIEVVQDGIDAMGSAQKMQFYKMWFGVTLERLKYPLNNLDSTAKELALQRSLLRLASKPSNSGKL